MTHGLYGGVQGDIDDMKRQWKLIEAMTRRMAHVYGRRTSMVAGGRSIDEWYASFQTNSEDWWSAEEALQVGLVDRIAGA
jgi:ATP-dependent protease ClpP protease subunit